MSRGQCLAEDGVPWHAWVANETSTMNHKLRKFNSQLNTSGREPTTCDTPVSHSIDIPEELKVLRSLEH